MEQNNAVQVLSRSASDAEAITDFASHHATAARLADGFGDAHAYLVRFEAGGAIGRHEAGFGQLFVVLVGRGWVSGDDGERVTVDAGDVVFFNRGEHHAKGSDSGMTAVMFQVRDLTPAS